MYHVALGVTDEAYYYIFYFKFGVRLSVCRTIKWYVMARMKFVREGLQRIEENSASFWTQSDIVADADAYEAQERLTVLCNLVSGYISIGSVWKLASVHSLDINKPLSV